MQCWRGRPTAFHQGQSHLPLEENRVLGDVLWLCVDCQNWVNSPLRWKFYYYFFNVVSVPVCVCVCDFVSDWLVWCILQPLVTSETTILQVCVQQTGMLEEEYLISDIKVRKWGEKKPINKTGSPLKRRNHWNLHAFSSVFNVFFCVYLDVWLSTGGSRAESDPPNRPIRPATGFQSEHQIMMLSQKCDFNFILFEGPAPEVSVLNNIWGSSTNIAVDLWPSLRVSSGIFAFCAELKSVWNSLWLKLKLSVTL